MVMVMVMDEMDENSKAVTLVYFSHGLRIEPWWVTVDTKTENLCS